MGENGRKRKEERRKEEWKKRRKVEERAFLVEAKEEELLKEKERYKPNLGVRIIEVQNVEIWILGLFLF